MDNDNTCYICFENEPKYGCQFHPICHSCINKWRQECWKLPHRFIICPYCRDILQHEKDDRDIIYCDVCDKDVLVHKKNYFPNKRALNKKLFETSDKFQDLILKDVCFLFNK